MTRSSMRSAKKVRASTDQQQVQEDQPPVTQSPGFIIGMFFLGVIIAIIISVLIFRALAKSFEKLYENQFKSIVVDDRNLYVNQLKDIVVVDGTAVND